MSNIISFWEVLIGCRHSFLLIFQQFKGFLTVHSGPLRTSTILMRPKIICGIKWPKDPKDGEEPPTPISVQVYIYSKLWRSYGALWICAAESSIYSLLVQPRTLIYCNLLDSEAFSFIFSILPIKTSWSLWDVNPVLCSWLKINVDLKLQKVS